MGSFDAALGALRSVGTTLCAENPPKVPLYQSIPITLVLGVLTGGLGAFFGYAREGSIPKAAVGALLGALVAVTFVLVLLAIGKKHATTYVGTHGIARYTTRGRGVRAEILRFVEVASLDRRRREVSGAGGRHYVNVDTWTYRDVSGRTLFEVEVPYLVDGPLERWEMVHFARAAEASYEAYRTAMTAAAARSWPQPVVTVTDPRYTSSACGAATAGGAYGAPSSRSGGYAHE